MALVRRLDQIEASDRYRLHEEVEATYAVFKREGKTLLQINTHGTRQRQLVGKRTQNFQIDQQGAEALVQVLRRTFNIT